MSYSSLSARINTSKSMDCINPFYPNFVQLDDNNVRKCALSVNQIVYSENAIVFLHMRTCPYTLPIYPIWDAAIKELINLKEIQVIQIDKDAVLYLKEHGSPLYNNLLSEYQGYEGRRILFPTILYFKRGKKYMLQIENLRNKSVKEAKEALLQFVYYHTFKNHMSPKSQTSSELSARKSSSRTTSTVKINKPTRIILEARAMAGGKETTSTKKVITSNKTTTPTAQKTPKKFTTSKGNKTSKKSLQQQIDEAFKKALKL
jgi:hypothetical protein